MNDIIDSHVGGVGLRGFDHGSCFASRDEMSKVFGGSGFIEFRNISFKRVSFEDISSNSSLKGRLCANENAEEA